MTLTVRRSAAHTHLSSKKQATPLEKMELSLWRFLEMSPQMTVTAAAFLLYVARCNERGYYPSASEVSRELAVTFTNASRTASTLAQIRVGEPEKAQSLLEIRPCEDNRRRHNLHITEAGLRAIKNIAEIFE